MIGYHNYSASLENSYSSGSVSGTDKAGGLVGWNSNSSITYCYSKGPVTGTTDTGGLVGYYTGGGSTLTASYWDKETSGQTGSAAGTGKTSAQMKTASTYIPNGWNFDDPWGINAAENGGYPFFRSQGFTPMEVFIKPGQGWTVVETAAEGTIIGTAAAVVQNSSGSLQDWQITAGNGDGKFEIVASTGEIKVAAGASLDYETTTRYTLTLTVSDGTTTSGSEDITIDIGDVDETIPVITASQVFDVDENTTEDTLGIVEATDSDPETEFQDWTITAGNDLGYFALNDSTGRLTLAPGATLDYETTTQYILTLTVGDGTNTSAAETITININQVNEDPVVDDGLRFSVDENTSDGTSVGTVTGTDEDAGTTLQSWTIASGNEDGDFDINGSTGEITVATGASLDYDIKSQYNLMVTVSDGTNTSAEEEVIIYLFQGILYVDADATGSDDGGSWANAFTDLQSALATADGDQQIWVAEGTYIPSVPYDFDGAGGAETRESVFVIPDSVEVYGGFNGTETLLVDRDPETNITILSGDLNGDDGSGGDKSENAYHVVFFNSVSDQTVFDGFTITGGNASITSMTNNAYGGGIFNYAVVNSSTPVVRNCIIDNNFAYRYGGGIYNRYHSTVAQAEYINCRITNNSTYNYGAGVANNGDGKNCSPVFINCIFEGNTAYNGTIYNRCYTSGTSTPTFTNCLIINNSGSADGVAVYDAATATLSPVYTNCLIAGNKSIYSNTVIYTYTETGGSYAGEFINCTVSGNSGYYGSGMYNYQQAGTNAPVIKNSIIAGNYVSGPTKRQLVNNGATPVISYSIIEGSGGSSSWTSIYGTDGGNNLDTDPLFLEPIDGIDAPSANGNYRLATGSPALDAGNNSYNSTGEDLDDENRIQNSTIDMGAYEGFSSFTEDIFYVNVNATGNNDGTNWANAFTDLEDALAKAASGDQVWVAAGTYYPTSQGTFYNNDGTDGRKVTFQLRNGVKMYGGFAGTESTVKERNISLYETILSGDIDQNDQSGGDSTGNAYHVIYLTEPASDILIDGFTITRGNANGGTGYNSGGGVLIESSVENAASSPTIINCSFKSNYGYYGGGLYNEYCTPVIRSCSFTDNRASAGGGVYNDHSEAVYAEVLFYSNSAASRGGAAYNNYDEPAFINCEIRGNESNEGGGFYNHYSGQKCFNTLITGNYASSTGGGVRNWGNDPGTVISPEFINTTISGNYATSNGGGMTNTYAAPVMTNSIVWNNDAPSYPEINSYNGFFPVFSHSIKDPSITGTDAGNNSTQDPQFTTELDPADAPSTGGDFTVTAGSPAINAGDDSVIPVDTLDLDDDGDDEELIPIDLAGNVRQDQAVDIGPYEINLPPSILFINRKDPVEEATNANAVTFEVIFSEPVAHVHLSDFILSGTASATLNSIIVLPTETFEINVTEITGDGLLNLDLDPGQDIEDLAGFALNTAIGSEESYYLDNTCPSPPGSLDLLADDDTGDSDSDNITSVNTPRISGTAEYKSGVNLMANGDIPLGSAIADISGNWMIISAALEDGTYSLKATATDTVGNESALSTTLAIEIDTTAPVLSMKSTSVTDNTFGPVTFKMNVQGADHQALVPDSVNLVTDIDVTGDITIDSLSTAHVALVVANITGSGNFHLAIKAGVFSDVAGNLSRTFNTDEIAIVKDDPGLSLDTITPKTYGDGTFTLTATTNSDGTLTYSSSDEGILSVTGDQATVLKAGTVTIIVDQAESSNYLAGQDEQVLVITKANLQVTAGDKNRVYGQANPDLTVTYAGYVTGEDSSVLATLPVATTTADEHSDAGTYDITAGGGVDENYEFTYITGTLTVSKVTLTVTADDQEKTYGQENPDLTFTYEGFVTGEDSMVLETLPAASTVADNSSGTGTYEITVIGGTDNNYDFSYIPGTLTITGATLIVTADDQSRIYGQDNPDLTFTYAGFVNGEDSTVLDTLPVVYTVADVNTGTGTYNITVSGGYDNNYDLTYIAGTLTIMKATLVVTANDKTRLYGQENPELTYTFAGFVNAEDSTVLDSLPHASTIAGPASNAGAYNITVSGGGSGNYTLTYTSGTLTVLKAALAVSADNKSRPYGQPNPVLTITYSGFVNGEDSTALDNLPQATTTADINSDAGTYDILVSGGSDLNYELSYIAGVLTVTQADQFITFDSIGPYNMREITEFELAATASSGLEVSFGSSDTDVATVTETTVTLTGTGTTTISAIQAGNVNYYAADTVTRILLVTYDHDPVFVSGDTALFAENGTGVALDVNANDGDGGAADEGITYSLTGGYDHYLFTLDAATGEVKYKHAPDFEMPADTNHDNTYELQVTAVDGAYSAYQNIVIIVTNVNEAPVVATTIADQTFTGGFVSSTLDLGNTFTDEDGDSLTLSAISANEAVVKVSVSGKVLTITEAGVGTSHVTITADDGNGGIAVVEFVVAVNAAGNHPPAVLNEVPDQVVEEGFGSLNIYLDNTFTDADDDSLILNAVSDNVTVVIAEVNGTTLTISEKGTGLAIVTVSADDGRGGWVTDAFTVTVNPKPNNAPTVAVPLTDQSYNEGFVSADIDLGSTFADADGDSLNLSAVSGKLSVITVSISGTVLTLTEVSAGSAIITVTAEDGRGGSISDEFLVTVNAAGNTLPVLLIAIPDQSYNEGFGSSVVGLAHRFTDADGDTLTFTAQSSDNGVITVAVSDTLLTISEVDTGTATITVTADDGNGGTVTDEFTVTVVHVNIAPVVANALADRSYNKGFGSSTVDLGSVFTDADGDVLTFLATPSDAGVVTVAVSDSTLTITEVDTGTTVITVTANDGNGGTVTDEFTVTVTWINNKPVFLSGNEYLFPENSMDMVADINASNGEGGPEDAGIIYSISGGAGGEDRWQFSIDADLGYLYFLTAPDFEQPADFDGNNIYRLNITAYDGVDTSILRISVTVQDVNEPPQGLYFNGMETTGMINLYINENAPPDSVIGVFGVRDEDVSASYTFELVDAFSNSVTTFYMVDSILRIGDTLNYEEVSYYQLRVRVFETGSGVEFYDRQVQININDMNDPPIGIWLNIYNPVVENVPPPFYIGTLTVQDEDCCDQYTYSFYDTIADNNNNLFSLVSDQLYTAASFDYEEDSVLVIYVIATDNTGLSSGPQSFTIKVVNVDDGTGIGDAATYIKIYPNPVSDILTVKSSARIDQLVLMDLSGRVLEIKTEVRMIDVSSLDAGIYILKVRSEAGVFEFRFVKE